MRKNNGPRKGKLLRRRVGWDKVQPLEVVWESTLSSNLYLLYSKLSSVLHLSKKKKATKQGMGQNISCLTQLNEEISETSQLVSVPNPLLRRRSESDGSKGTVARARVPKSDWDSTNEDGFWLFFKYCLLQNDAFWETMACVGCG